MSKKPDRIGSKHIGIINDLLVVEIPELDPANVIKVVDVINEYYQSLDVKGKPSVHPDQTSLDHPTASITEMEHNMELKSGDMEVISEELGEEMSEAITL